jgi:pimeloyl-ACP methyl ester carboxylesterase
MNSLKMIIASLALSASAYAIDVPKDFVRETVQVPGVKLNVYKGGHGEPLVLLHGYAESALMWEAVMKKLSNQYTIIVPDLRGAGLSEVTADGYTKSNMARDVKALLDHYKIEKARIVGHDIGLMVAYSFAAQYPAVTQKLVVMDAFLPGVGPGDDIYNSPDIWHFRFHGASAEKLVKGREKDYLNALWNGFSANPASFPDEKKNYFAKQYAAPGHMKAGFEWFKAFPQDAVENREFAKTKLTMPVLVIGGEKAMGIPLEATMKVVAPDLHSVIIPNTGHWLLEENPTATIKALADFL